jgi:hypothetical protein
MIAELLGTVVTGVLSGGATGLIGIALQQWGDSRKRTDDLARLRLEHEQTRELAKLEADKQLELAKLGADSAERLAQLQAEARIEESADLNYRASFEHDRATYLDKGAQAQSRAARWMMAVVDFVRGIIRPGATIYSMGLLTVLMLWVRDLYARTGVTLTPDQTMRLVMEIVGTCTYLATTTTVWWFGVRPAQRR